MVLRRSFPGQARFEDLLFGESSGILTWPEAVAYGAKNGGILQSALESMVYRMWSGDDHKSGQIQAIRTAAIYYVHRGQWCVAFDDAPNPEENVLLARAEEGYRAHYDSYDIYEKKNKDSDSSNWVLPKTDPIVSALLERARRDGRIIQLGPIEGQTSWTGKHHVTRWDEEAEWYRPVESQLLNAILNDSATKIALHITVPSYAPASLSLLSYAHPVPPYPSASLFVLSRGDLKKLDFKEGEVNIVPVSIGGSVVDCTARGVHYLIGGGIARGVGNAREFEQYRHC